LLTHSLKNFVFDYCIVDEASQITQPVCLGPLRFAKVFVLVGDHYQLPPLIRSNECKEQGMTESLFRRLSEAHPQAVVNLEYQYRMNNDIMYLCNELIYNNRLRCAIPAVAENPLIIPKIEVLKNEQKWIRDICDPKFNVIFLDTDKVPAIETRSGDILQNEVEALLVYHITVALINAGVSASTIGIISPYRSQLQLVRQNLKEYMHSKLGNDSVEVHTVDKYQGRDKDCIIISLVRSNQNQNIGDLLRDWRRVNVALTRARKKMIILGSQCTLQGTQLFSHMLDLLKKKDWVYILPPSAHKRIVDTSEKNEVKVVAQNNLKRKYFLTEDS